MADYQGLIPRHDLVNFCRNELPRLDKENTELASNIDIFERLHGDNVATIQAFNLGLAENIGFQKALRAVCEWAKDHIVEEPAIADPEDDIDRIKAELRERLSGNG